MKNFGLQHVNRWKRKDSKDTYRRLYMSFLLYVVKSRKDKRVITSTFGCQGLKSQPYSTELSVIILYIYRYELLFSSIKNNYS